ncbi:ATP-binding protein [Diplocloster hominis]|uniref:ATP-binding protein n=1 Tax=Diplocloster hominis TaxID=3079010 RepID=UPI0031BB4003
MIIQELDIKNFGKFHNKQIQLSEGLNLIYGENEAGKSTIHTFIRGMLFGMEKQRGRASASDTYRIYEPWENPVYYAGRMRFVCGGKVFRLSRSFARIGRKTELVCETDGEELSVDQGDLCMLLDQMTETVYRSTLCIGQQRAGTEESLAQALGNYMAAYEETGDTTLDVSEAVKCLKENRKDLNTRKKALQLEWEKQIQSQEMKRELLEEEIRQKEEKQKQLSSEIAQAASAIGRIQVPPPVRSHEKRIQHTSSGAAYRYIASALMLAGLLGVIFFPWMTARIGSAIIIAGAIILLLTAGNRKIKNQKETVLKEEILSNEPLQLKQKEWACRQLLEEIQELRLKREAFALEQAEETSALAQIRRLDDQLAAVDLAETTIRQIAEEIHAGMGSKLERTVSMIFAQMTGQKYNRIHLDEKLKLKIHTSEQILTPEQVSRGTMEQLYFALRMAVGRLFCKDSPMPILLDDAFAYYDRTRLEQTLRWLLACPNQVLLFTCHTREQEILDEWGVPYHKVHLTDN